METEITKFLSSVIGEDPKTADKPENTLKTTILVVNIEFIIFTLIGFTFTYVKMLELELSDKLFIFFYISLGFCALISVITLFYGKIKISSNVIAFSLFTVSILSLTAAFEIRSRLLLYRQAAVEFQRDNFVDNWDPKILLVAMIEIMRVSAKTFDNFSVLAMMSLLFFTISYLIAEANFYCLTFALVVISYTSLGLFVNKILGTPSTVAYVLMITCIVGVSICSKYYQKRLLEYLNRQITSLKKAKAFFMESLTQMNQHYLLLKDGEIKYSNLKNASLVVYSSVHTDINVGDLIKKVLEAIQEESNVKVGILEDRENKLFYQASVRKYKEGYAEVFLADVTHIVERERVEMEHKCKKAFLAKIAHEFKTPVANVLEVIEKMPNSQETRTIQGLCKYITFLVADITTYFNTKALFTPIKTEIKVKEVAKVCFGVLKALLKTKENKQVKAILENKIEEHVLFTDYTRLSQIIVNLLSNAVKFTFSGEIKLKCFQEGKCAVFEVEDTGTGINPQKLKEIQQNSLKLGVSEYNLSGTQLGLSICNKLVDLLDFKLEIQSKEGEETKAKVLLETTEEQVSFASESQQATVLFNEPMAALPVEEAAKTVIVAEDNALIRNGMVNIVRSIRKTYNKAWEVVEVSDGAFTVSEAISATLSGREVSFILTDEFMDFVNGTESLKILNSLVKQGKMKKIAYISCSAFEDDSFREKVESAAVDQVIEKPATYSTLIAVLKELSII